MALSSVDMSDSQMIPDIGCCRPKTPVCPWGQWLILKKLLLDKHLKEEQHF